MKRSASACVILVVCIVAIATSFAEPVAVPYISARATEVDVVREGDRASATFKIQVTNHTDSPVENVWVVFDDDTSVPIGDVNAYGTVVSDLQNRVVPLTLPESQSIPVPVKFTLSFEGESFEVLWVLNLGEAE